MVGVNDEGLPTKDDEPGSTLAAVQISKRFGSTVALRAANFDCRAGEVHVLFGANGAGKSTLVKILSGVQAADTGVVRIDGRVVSFRNVLDAVGAGVSAVFQELSLCPHLTVAENVLLAREPLGVLGHVSNAVLRRTVRALFDRIGIGHISPDSLVSDLTLAERQIVEIAKAMSQDPRVLILDEGTSALGRGDVQRLFDLVRGLRSRGKSIIFISHRMAEIREIADRITVFRDGHDVATRGATDIGDAEIIELMIGKHVGRWFPVKREIADDAPVVLDVSHMTLTDALEDVSLTVRQGEVLGLAGVEGQGQGDLLLTLFGVNRRSSGSVSVRGERVRLGAPWRSIRSGFSLVPEDRKTQGLILQSSIRENIVLANMHKLARWAGFTNRRLERAAARRGMERMEVKADDMEAPMTALSGGNQQKVVVAKWLETGGDVFMFYDPTRGVDVGTKHSFYDLVSGLAADNKAILLYSTELSELVGLCHRVLVFGDHKVVACIEGASITEQRILSAALGVASGTRGG